MTITIEQLQYDKEVEINEKQYREVTTQFAGCVAHRKNANQYYIKVWAMKYVDSIYKLLKICEK